MLRRASFHSLLCLPRPHARHASFRYQFTRVFSSFPTPGNRSASSPSCDAVDAYGHPRIPFRGHYDREKCDKRRSWAESFTGKKLGFLSDWWAEDKETDASLLPCDRALTQLRGNVENPIGLAKIPVGLVGPLLVYGKHTNGYYLCPYATTEGALVASATRGAIACNRAGGVRASASQQRVMRAPVFVTGSIQQADALADWLVQALPDLQEQVSGVSRHCRLIDLEPLLVGRTVHILFCCSTGEAAGQNMVTMVTDKACKWALQQIRKSRPDIKVLQYIVEGNASGDKKMAGVTLLRPRGFNVRAESYIPESVLKNVLKIDVNTLLSTYSIWTQGALRSGQQSNTVNATNALAAVFTATGQDIACVAESSSAHLTIEPASGREIDEFGLRSLSAGLGVEFESEPGESGVYVSLTLPSLIVGTVGGGTGLATQKECLDMMDCTGENGNFRLAEIIASTCLGLDLSTLSALGTGQFATGHERLGRNRPDLGLKPHHLDAEFFSKVIGSGCEAQEWKPLPVDSRNSILSDIVKNKDITKVLGILGFEVTYKDASEKVDVRKVAVKSKATDLETCNMINKMAQGCLPDFAKLYELHKLGTGFRFTHDREMAILEMQDPYVTSLTPKTYFTWKDPHKDIFVIAMEYMENMTHFNSADDVSDWTENDIKVVLRDAAKFHSVYLNKVDKLLSDHPYFAGMSSRHMIRLQPLWEALVGQNGVEFPEIVTPDRCKLAYRLVDNIPAIFQGLEAAPRALIHNDFNPRNVCIRPLFADENFHGNETGFSDSRQTCAYDWELANVDVPQHDVAEFLSYVLPPGSSVETRHDLVDFHRQQLEFYSGSQLDKESYLRTFFLASCDLAINRLALCTMSHMYKDYRFLPRVIASHFDYLQETTQSSNLAPFS